jgi:hypothetical protein
VRGATVIPSTASILIPQRFLDRLFVAFRLGWLPVEIVF